MDEKRLARLITDAVVRRPLLWRLLRPRMRGLPFETGSFDLVVAINAVPFFDELARRSTSPASGSSASSKRGFTGFRSFSADPATAFRAQKL